MMKCIYDYISNNKCIKCMILMHEIVCCHLASALEQETTICFRECQVTRLPPT